jgi:hypothetical protein
LVISKINHPTLQLQIEGAYYHYSNRPYGWEVPSEDNALGSPLPLPLRVIPSVMLCTQTFYTCLLFCFSAILCQIILLFVFETITVLLVGMSYCLFDLRLGVRSAWYLDISKHLAFQLHHNNYISTVSTLPHKCEIPLHMKFVQRFKA